MKKTLITSFFALTAIFGQAQVWNQVTVPTNENLLDIEFPPGTTSVGYIGGENGTLLKTTDGGLNWAQVNHTGINAPLNFHFQDLEFANDNVGYAALAGTMGLYKTMDGGSTWTEMDDFSIGAFCFRNTLHVFDENHFMAAGSGCFQSAMIIEYNNGVWSEKVDPHETFSAMQYVKDLEFRGNLGMATINSNLFLRSTDGGQNWDTIPSPIFAPNGTLTDVIIVNDTLVYAGHEVYSGHYLFFQSNDAGATWWEMQPTGGDLIFYASWFAFEGSNNGDLYASASQLGGPHYMHENNNGSWSYEMIDQRIVSIDSYSTDVVYAVGDSGYVIVNSGTPLSLEEMELNARLYPNPSNGLVTLELESAVQANVSITDLSGKKIRAMEVIGSAQFSIEDWNSGVYIVTVDNGEQKSIRRLIKQ